MNSRVLITLFCLSASISLRAAPLEWDNAKVKTSQNTVAVRPDGDGAIIAEFHTGRTPWPYLVILPKDGKPWDLSRFRRFSFDVENLSREYSAAGEVNLGMWSKYKIGNFALRPGEKRTFTWPINHQGNQAFDPLFKGKGMPPGFQGGTNTDTAAVSCVNIICGFARDCKFRISNLRVHGEYKQDPATLKAETFFPFIDDFGQYIHTDWPGKVRSAEQLKQSFRDESAALRPRPASWDKWGGWKDGPALEATGFFRVEKYKGKWYLVDPDGRLFFSRGVNSISRGAYWPTKGMERVYTRKSARPDRIINFYDDNCGIRYGQEPWEEFQVRRMADWGFNTAGNWSGDAVYRTGKIPYTLNLPLPSVRQLAKDNRTPDVYDPKFEPGMRQLLKGKYARTVNDPFCIGYFIGNELPFGDAVKIAAEAFLGAPDQPARNAFLTMLREKYGSIGKLNSAWGSSYATWQEPGKNGKLPDAKRSRADFEAFTSRFLERFFALSRDAVKTDAPRHLYLGSRTMSADRNRAFVNRLSAKYCDIVSQNDYGLRQDNFTLEGVPADKPVMITESSVGHRGHGLAGILAYPGCEPGAREAALQCLLESAAAHPQIVGIHHFNFKDQTLIGRWDGENYGFGLVDVTDTPYRDFVAANREFAERLYPYRAESVSPPIR